MATLTPTGEYGGGLRDKVCIAKERWFEQIKFRPSDPESGPYVPYENQLAFHRGRERFRLCYGPARAGKSRASSAELGPVLLTPNTRTWIVAPKYELGVFEFHYLSQDLRDAGFEFERWICNPDSGRIFFQLKELGSWCKVVSAKPGYEDGLLGEELDFALMAEATRMSKKVWDEYIRHRLRSRSGCAAFVTAPKGRRNWVNVLFEKLKEHPEYGLYHLDADKNPGNLEKNIGKDEISEAAYVEQVEGRPVAEFGDVFSEFEPSRHVINAAAEGFERYDCDKYGGIDFGYRDPFAAVLLSVLGKGRDARACVIWEYEKRKTLIRQHARKLKREFGHFKNVHASYCDWDPERIRQLRRNDLDVKRAKKGFEAGIATVNQLFAEDRLFVSAGCPRLSATLQGLEFDADETRPPKGQDDHLPDAFRYVVHSLLRKGEY